MTEEALIKLRAASREMRKDILHMALKAGANGAHIGGALSSVEILAALYLDALNLDAAQKDLFILSKGHCVMSQYAAMRQAGLLSSEDLQKFEDPASPLCSHATMSGETGVEFSTGSLGQGLSLGAGVALGMKKRGASGRVFVLLGDGECNEGQVWEAAQCAAHFGLGQLAAIVDANGMQLDGFSRDVMEPGDLAAKWKSFGWDVQEVDGHDPLAVARALKRTGSAPSAIIARTIKGKGISIMENAPAWHHGRLSRKQYEQALSELEGL